MQHGNGAKFALITRNDAGDLIQRTFQLEGYLVRKINEQPYDMKTGTPGATLAGKPQSDQAPEPDVAGTQDEKSKPPILDRLRSFFGFGKK